MFRKSTTLPRKRAFLPPGRELQMRPAAHTHFFKPRKKSRDPPWMNRTRCSGDGTQVKAIVSR